MTTPVPVRRLAPWIVLLARVGYAAKGIVFIVIGALAARAAAGSGGATTDQKGALRAIAGGPFGTIALGIIGVGLLGYMAWRIVAAITDAERKGNDPTSLAMRIGQAGRGVAYGLLGLQALRVAGSGHTTGNSSTQARHWSARLLDLPMGRALLFAIGLTVIGYAGYQFWRATSDRVRKHLDLASAGSMADHIVTIGRFGIAARAVVFVLVGIFLISAARHQDASHAGGIADSLATLGNAPYGRIALTVVALGLMAYGLYQLATARYRRMRAT